MKRIIQYIILSILLLLPFGVLAEGDITVSPSNLTIEKGSSKTFIITAKNTIGDVTIKSSNTNVATISSNFWETGIIESGRTVTETITVTGIDAGSATITLTIDAATYDEEDLSGQTRTVTISVVPKSSATTTTTTTKSVTSKATTTTKKSVTSKVTTTTTSNQKSTTNNNLEEKTTTTEINTTTKENNNIKTGLKQIIINSKKILIKNDKYEYDIDIEDDNDSLDLDFEKYDDKQTIKVIGNENLKIGNNKIEIIVSEEDGSSVKYILNVNKKQKITKETTTVVNKNVKKSNKVPIIIMIVIALALSSSIIILLKKINKEKNIR